jgi:Tfp pilus assembly protein PilF
LPAPVKRRAAAHLFLGIALVLVPLSARRYGIDRGLSPFAASGGLNFYIGNNPAASGGFVSLEHLNVPLAPGELVRQSVAVAAREAGRKLSASEASAHWFRKGLRFAADNPGRFVVLTLKKCLLFWNRGEGESNINVAFSRTFLLLFGLPFASFAVVGPLALTGLALAAWRRDAALSLIGWLAGAYMLSLALLFMASRYRFPCVPLLVVAAAYALRTVWGFVRERRVREAAAALAVIAVSAVVVNVKVPGMPAEENFAVARFNLGTLLLEQGRLDQAAAEYLKIPPSDPNYARSRYNLALAYERAGMTGRAAAEYENALRAKPDFAKAHNNLGLLLYRQGRKEDAARRYRQALAIDPTLDEALVNLAWYYRDRGMLDEAADADRRALAANPDNAAAHYDLAVQSYYRKEFAAAAEDYREARRLGHAGNAAFRDALAKELPGGAAALPK